MQLNSTDQKTLVSSTNSEDFKMEMNGTLFSMLSSDLYEHKITAVVREILSNVYDAHEEAGKLSTPALVTLPNHLAPYFTVEDFGVGMDEHTVRTVLAGYGVSTKTNSNNGIGGFGSGGKSPFAYTDSFFIRSRKDGIEQNFACYVGDDWIPKLDLLTTTSTHKGNGVEVKIPVKAQDFIKFKNECEVILSFLNIEYEIKGVESFTPFADREGYLTNIKEKGYAEIPLRSKSSLYSHNKFYAEMGGVLYRIPTGAIIDQCDKSHRKVFSSSDHAYVFHFDIGAIRPAGSRETLSLDDKTGDAVINKINEVVADVVEIVQTEIDSNASHPVEAMRIVEHYHPSNSAYELYEYKGKSLSTHYRRKTIFRREYTSVGFVNRKGARVECSSESFLSLNEVADSGIYVVYRTKDDPASSFGGRARKWIREHSGANHGTRFMIFNEPKTPHQVKRVKAYLGETATIVSWSDIKDHFMKKDRVERKERETGTKTSTTVYATSYKGGQHQPARHVDVNDPTYVYFYYDDGDVNPRSNYIEVNGTSAPMNIFSSSVSPYGKPAVLLKRNKMNAKAIEALKIPHYSECYDDFVAVYSSAIKEEALADFLMISGFKSPDRKHLLDIGFRNHQVSGVERDRHWVKERLMEFSPQVTEIVNQRAAMCDDQTHMDNISLISRCFRSRVDLSEVYQIRNEVKKLEQEVKDRYRVATRGNFTVLSDLDNKLLDIIDFYHDNKDRIKALDTKEEEAA